MIKNYIHDQKVHNTNAASIIIPVVFDFFKVNSVLDVGCGLGTWLEVAKKHGVATVCGIDGNKADERLLKINSDEFRELDLTKEINFDKQFDLAICLEVAEHLPESAANELVNTLTKSSNIILFSAAVPNQSGQNHINEQWPSYWQAKFYAHGYFAFDILRKRFWSNENIEWWYKQNIMIYAKKEYSNVLGEPTDEVLNLIHPELLKLKIDQNLELQNQVKSLEFTIESRLNKPKFLPALKNLLKSIIK